VASRFCSLLLGRSGSATAIGNRGGRPSRCRLQKEQEPAIHDLFPLIPSEGMAETAGCHASAVRPICAWEAPSDQKRLEISTPAHGQACLYNRSLNDTPTLLHVSHASQGA